jgi:hypothetical protein
LGSIAFDAAILRHQGSQLGFGGHRWKIMREISPGRNEISRLHLPSGRPVPASGSPTGRVSIYEQGDIIGNRNLCGHFINTLL